MAELTREEILDFAAQASRLDALSGTDFDSSPPDHGWRSGEGTPVSERELLLDWQGNIFVHLRLVAGTELLFVPSSLVWAARMGSLDNYRGPPARKTSVAVEERLEGATERPYAYAWSPSQVAWKEAVRGERLWTRPALHIVAAPGVSIETDERDGLMEEAADLVEQLQSWLLPLNSGIRAQRTGLSLNVVRVQDSGAVPPLGMPIEFSGHADLEDAIAGAASQDRSVPFFHRRQRADGESIELFPLGIPRAGLGEAERRVPDDDEVVQALGVAAAELAAGLGLRLDPRRGYGMSIKVPLESATAAYRCEVESARIRSGPPYTVRLLRTEAVEVTAQGFLSQDELAKIVSFYERVVPLDEVMTAPLEEVVQPGATRIEPPEGLLELLNAALGFLPVIGELSDLLDLLSHRRWGTDKFGRPMTDLDAALVFLALFIPLASKGSFTLLKRGRDVGRDLALALESLDEAEKTMLVRLGQERLDQFGRGAVP